MSRDRLRHRPEPNCDRCDAPLPLHFDGTWWMGCPYPYAAERRCGYQGCTETTIADAQLGLCAKHSPSSSRRESI